MDVALARCISILGHPLVLMPVSALSLAITRDASAQITRTLVIVLGALVAAALGFSIWSVLSGRWTHIDASRPSERSSLNLFLTATLLAASAFLWRNAAARELAIGLLIAGLAVAIALALLPRLKLSLHTCFGALAAGLLWPNVALVIGGACITAALVWSRLALRRHTLAETLLGCGVGGASAVGFHVLTG